MTSVDIHTGLRGTVSVALDPSRPAPPALEVARRVAEQAGYGVELVAATPPDLDEQSVERYLASLVEEDGSRTESCQELGAADPAEAVLTHLGTGSTTLLCLESHARTAAGELAFGSVSEEIVRRSTVPVLVCGPRMEPVPRFTRLLAGLDGSAAAEQAMEAAFPFAAALGAPVALLEVLPPDVTVPSDIAETAYLSRVRANVPIRIDDFDTVHHRRPAQALVDAAAGAPGTILVVGTHGRSGLERLRLGSVALDVVRHAPCPVLVVPSRH